MKKLLLILTAILIGFAAFPQKYYLVHEGQIVQAGMPDHFPRANGEYVAYGYRAMSEYIHYVDGWRAGAETEYNDSLQLLGEPYYDSICDCVLREVIDKTQAQLDAEIQLRYDSENSQIDYNSIKAILRESTKENLESDSLTQSQLDSYLYLYDVWDSRSVAYELGDIVRYDSALWKVITPHTSQPDWNPKVAISLFVKKQVNNGSQILNWDYPVEYWNGTDGIHQQSIVKYNGVEYKCIQSHTSQAGWTPDVVGALWSVN